MLVYANRFSATGLDAQIVALRAIHGWLKKKLNGSFMLPDICKDGEFKGAGPEHSWLRCEVFGQVDEYKYAWRLKHSDESVRGRQWVIDIGLATEYNRFELTCSVQVDDISTLVQSRVLATRPALIKFVLDNLKGSSSVLDYRVPGGSVKEVGESVDSYRALLNIIESEARAYPIILVSPDRSGAYHFNVERLQEQLFGLAQVVKVSPSFDSYDMEEQLGRKWSAWDGALNIIPTRKSNGFIGSKLIRSDELFEAAQDRGLTSYILSLVTHQTNIPLSRGRLTLESVNNLKLRHRLAERRAQLISASNNSELEDELALVWEEIESQSQRIKSLENDKYTAEIQIEELQSIKDDLESQVRSLKYKAKQIAHGQMAGGRDVASNVLDVLEFASRSDKPTPRECLELIESIFPDRCEILETALESADEVSGFTHSRRLLDMLRRLMTTYIDAMLEGGDSKAMEVFTNSEYAANESETVMNNSALKQRRLFVVNGEEVYMPRHLKIGKADDTRKTIRIHFAWFPEKRKIVIGYCGEHLPIKSH
ncbi:hypothetical protein ACM8BA_04930 [Pseudomonas aeruginosa]|uniref:hypothetical protein n=1 Tax=Pseudomonas aeruginosa TaxID=287 RepID=UPI0022A078B7|nr:hypothetical protein [Pseudomonas aeruginosa]MDY1184900.1 hypothetical protein [Pseudomonas aeruginosa]HCT6678356.1 hypothetical protein [Pseudomonas aeruginosa]HCT9984743.1 hypothetical protein [Pseudomonas aeruginosa]